MLEGVYLRWMSSTVNLFVVPEEKDEGQERCHNKKRFL